MLTQRPERTTTHPRTRSRSRDWPLFHSLAVDHRGITSGITGTRGYYWMNVSRGLASFSATCAYLDDDELKTTSMVSDVMRTLDGKSSLVLATVAIPVTCPVKSDTKRMALDRRSLGLHGCSIARDAIPGRLRTLEASLAASAPHLGSIPSSTGLPRMQHGRIEDGAHDECGDCLRQRQR